MPILPSAVEHIQDRVNVYIDGSNLYHLLHHRFGRTDLNFLSFARKLSGQRRLQRIYYYSAPIDNSRQPTLHQSQQRFFQHLRHISQLELRLGRLVYAGGSNTPLHEKGVDVKLATDMVLHGVRNRFDASVLVSSDTDFRDAIQIIKSFGLQAEVALVDPSGSWALREVASKVIHIDRAFLDDCWRR